MGPAPEGVHVPITAELCGIKVVVYVGVEGNIGEKLVPALLEGHPFLGIGFGIGLGGFPQVGGKIKELFVFQVILVKDAHILVVHVVGVPGVEHRLKACGQVVHVVLGLGDALTLEILEKDVKLHGGGV